MNSDPDAYFVGLGDGRYRATAHTSGAWSESEQHISPMVGLCLHEIERLLTSPLLVSRIAVDILGTIAVSDFSITVSVVRPGRTIELVEAVVTWSSRPVLVARVWRLAGADTTSVSGGDPATVAAELPPWDMTAVWPGG